MRPFRHLINVLPSSSRDRPCELPSALRVRRLDPYGIKGHGVLPEGHKGHDPLTLKVSFMRVKNNNHRGHLINR